jgi:polysaccharide pyruvyl transferase WcaK-like protein
MIYHVFANRSNIGDWLSAKGIQKLLLPHTVKECLCDVPYISQTMDNLSEATDHDLIIIGGGGLFMDYFQPFWETFLSVVRNVPYVIWGIGYCDLKYEHTRPPLKLVEDIINKSKLSIVRDNMTRNYLKNCKLPEPVACPSLNVVKKDTRQDHHGLLHVDNYTTVGRKSYEIMCAAGQAFSEKNGLGYYSTNNRIKNGDENDMKLVLEKYMNSTYILSSALHGCIIGVAMGKKVLAVSGDWKIDAFMESVGLKDWVLDSKDTDHITEKLDELPNQREATSYVEKHRRNNENIAVRILQMIRNDQV